MPKRQITIILSTVADHWTIQVFADGAWQRAARLERANGTSRTDPVWLEYEIDYATAAGIGVRGHRAVSVRYPIDLDSDMLDHWPAFTLDLLPQGEALRLLRARLRREQGAVTDWAMLGEGGGNPVGNLRIGEAARESSNARGVDRDEVVRRGDQYRAWAEAEGIPMTGSSDTGGASPKLLLTEDEHGLLHADGALADDAARRHYVVKFPRGRTTADAQVLANEAPYLEVVRAMGLRVGAGLEYTDGVLFVPRFDRARDEGGLVRHGVESVYSLMGSIEAGARLAFEDVCEGVAHVVDDPHECVVELVLRDALAVALGNTDNHGRNTSLLKTPDGVITLSPVYDFAPMYKDPEGIKRVLRWRSEGLTVDWPDVCASLDNLVPREVLAPAMRDLGERMAGLPTLMRDHGVDDDIVTFREAWAREVADGLARVEG